MRVECPHCHQALNIVDADTRLGSTSQCPLCGSQLSLGPTVTYQVGDREQIAHFSLLEKVGSGQFGTVWKAYDKRLQRTVAIKLPRAGELDDKQRSMFEREPRAAAALEHPNVVRVHDVGQVDGQPYIVSEFIEGVTLCDRLESGGIDPREAATLMADIADAVHHAHEHGIVHRDLKPRNILVDTTGRPFVTDFGLARRDSGEITITISGMILGTPAYMSPEQARGDAHHADARSDVYSLGAVLYEMLTGQKPFTGSTRLLLYQIQSDDPRLPRSIDRKIPRDLQTICLRDLSKKPERRYQTAGALADDLRRFLAGETIRARPVTRLERSVRWVRRNPALSVATVCALLATGLAIAIVAGWGDSSTAREPQPPVAESGRPVQVQVITDPPGARIVCYPRDAAGEPIVDEAERATNLSPAVVELLPGDYLVVAVLDDEHFHEVYRRVPASLDELPNAYRHLAWTPTGERAVSWLTIDIPNHADVTSGMVKIAGEPQLRVGTNDATGVPQHFRRVGSFYLDSHEVTVAEFQAGNDGRPPRTGGWPEAGPQFPVTRLLYDEAVAWAERNGKRLPSEFEYELAATTAGTTRYPWGQQPPPEWDWRLGPVGQPDYDSALIAPAVVGLLSNAAEWTGSPLSIYPSDDSDRPAFVDSLSRDEVTVRGGPIGEPTVAAVENWQQFGARYRTGVFRRSRSDRLGFRCARSVRPRLHPDDFDVFD